MRYDSYLSDGTDEEIAVGNEKLLYDNELDTHSFTRTETLDIDGLTESHSEQRWSDTFIGTVESEMYKHFR